MSDHIPELQEPLFEQELVKINNPAEQAAFKFFYAGTKKEFVGIVPGYTWDQFHDGIAPFNGLPIEFVDQTVEDARLVPNYTPELTAKHDLDEVVEPMLTALNGPFIRSLHRARRNGAVRIVAIHPSMATPYIIARSIAASYLHEYGEDIRPSIHTVTGAYPTVFKYELRKDNGETMLVSPVDLGRCLGNLMLTAPKTANTLAEDKSAQEWMHAYRGLFKVNNREVLATRGQIEIVHPAGRRGKRSVATVPPFIHVEYLPDSSLDYITDIPVPTYIVGVADNLLNDPREPGSIVRVVGDPEPWLLKSDEDVYAALQLSASLASHGRETYMVESKKDREMRRAIEMGRRLIRRPKPHFE